MSYYPPWFDVAEWILIGAGLLGWLVMKAFAPGRVRGLLKLCGCLSVAVGMIFGGIGSLLFNERAPHLTAEGRFGHVVLHTGKGSSTYFDLLGGQAHDRLYLPSAKSEVQDGELADVTYQAQSGLVLSLHIVDGPHAGFDYSGTDHSFGAFATLFAALVLACYGVLNFVSDGTGEPAQKDNSPSPAGEADTGSMLDL